MKKFLHGFWFFVKIELLGALLVGVIISAFI